MNPRTDQLLGGRVTITQGADGYRAGFDAVMLAAACPAKPNDLILDLGCGAGAASLCLAVRVADLKITGIEIQPEQAEFARQNFTANHVTGEIITADLNDYAFPADYFNHVILNPPYHDNDQHTVPANAARAAAFMTDDLGAWLQTARRTVKTHGSVTIIHRADAVMQILSQLQNFGAVEIIPLWPRAGLAAERIIIRAVKGRKTPPCILPGIILHAAGGEATPALSNILRSGDSID